MSLTEKQKSINPYPEYWEWFQKWWDEDFSWAGLESKKTSAGTPLRTYYGKVSDQLINRFNRTWHPLNAPYHDLAGNVIEDSSSIKNAVELIIRISNVNEFYGILKSNDYFTGTSNAVSKLEWSTTSSFELNRLQSTRILNFCYINYYRHPMEDIQSSTIEFAKIGSIASNNSLTFHDCKFIGELIISISSNSLISLKNCDVGDQALLQSNQLELMDVRAKEVFIKPKRQRNEIVSRFDLSLTSPRRAQHVEIDGGYLPNIGLENAVVKIKLSKGSSLSLKNSEFKHLDINAKDLQSLHFENSKFLPVMNISNLNVSKLYIQNCEFRAGIEASNLTVKGIAKIKGTKIYSKTIFREAKFMGSFNCNPLDVDSEDQKPSLIENGDFEKSEFSDPSKSTISSSANFNDTKFIGSASFDQALFDGVPKFHGTTMHSETSFRNLKPFPDIENPAKKIDKTIYSRYNKAFQTLRQHMENKHNFATAFKFGRLEMLAKLRGGETEDTPKSELLFLDWYGKLADFGQNFIKPLKFLAYLWAASVCVQCLLFITLESTCFPFGRTCKVNWDIAGEAFERGSVFMFPPFTLLINRTIDGKLTPNTHWYTDILSGGGMVFHAIFATLLLFLFALGVKRRLQIK